MLFFEEAAVEILERTKGFAPGTLASASYCCFPGQNRFYRVARCVRNAKFFRMTCSALQSLDPGRKKQQFSVFSLCSFFYWTNKGALLLHDQKFPTHPNHSDKV